MELYKELNFMKAQNKYEESVKKNKEKWQKQVNEIRKRQALKQYEKFAKAIKEI